MVHLLRVHKIKYWMNIRDAPKWKFLAKTENEEPRSRILKHWKYWWHLLVPVHLWVWLYTNLIETQGMAIAYINIHASNNK